MKTIYLSLAPLLILLFTTSCLTHRHTVGKGPIGSKGGTQVHDKVKQGFVFWGLIPVNNSRTSEPEHGNYQIKTCFNFEDALISIVTCGVVSYRTIKVLEYKQDRIEGFDFEIEDKVTAQVKGETVLGEIVGIDAKKQRISFLYYNIYGEKMVRSSKPMQLTALSQHEYNNRMQDWQKVIATFKYKVGDYAIWPMNKTYEFGVITKLDDRTHKATIELTNVYNETLSFKVPYLDIKLIDSYEYEERVEDWEAVKQDYIFDIGESVRWEYGTEKFRNCRIISLNDSNHSAEVAYTDEKGEEKTSRAGYLKLTKMQNL